MIYKGSGSSLELLEDRLIIRRHGIGGLLLHGFVGEKTIPYSMITAVQFKRAGITTGYIQFTIAGGIESKKGAWEAIKDENTVCFGNNKRFEEARVFIEGRMGGRNPQPSQATIRSALDQLDKAASLFERGLLTREEFEVQKALSLRSGRFPSIQRDELDEGPDPVTQRMFEAVDRAAAGRLPQPAPAQRSPRVFGKRGI